MNLLSILLGYIVIVSQQFTLNIPYVDSIVAGYSIRYLLFYLFIVASLAAWIWSILKRGKISLRDLSLCLFIIVPFSVGLIYSWPLKIVVTESVLFVMPIAVYAWSRTTRLSSAVTMDLFLWTNIIGGILSVLVALSIINAGIWAAPENLVRTAGAVNSTLSIGGFCASIILLFVLPGNKSRKRWIFEITALVCSLLSLVLSQSRTRIVLMAGLVFVAILFNIFNRRSKYGTIRMIFLIILFIISVEMIFPTLLGKLVQQLQARFSNLQDANVTYRQLEGSEQLESFYAHPLMGMGWGSLSQYSDMYVHNIYTALLMQCGLFCTAIYLVWLLSYIRKSFESLRKNYCQPDQLIALFFMILLIILGITNAGMVQSGGYFMMLYVFLTEKSHSTERPQNQIKAR